jgi:hypothetical protein
VSSVLENRLFEQADSPYASGDSTDPVQLVEYNTTSMSIVTVGSFEIKAWACFLFGAIAQLRVDGCRSGTH